MKRKSAAFYETHRDLQASVAAKGAAVSQHLPSPPKPKRRRYTRRDRIFRPHRVPPNYVSPDTLRAELQAKVAAQLDLPAPSAPSPEPATPWHLRD